MENLSEDKNRVAEVAIWMPTVRDLLLCVTCIVCLKWYIYVWPNVWNEKPIYWFKETSIELKSNNSCSSCDLILTQVHEPKK
jgi:hypothetical protein